MLRPLAFAAFALATTIVRAAAAPAPAGDALALEPRPARVETLPNCAPIPLVSPLLAGSGVDPGAFALLAERWKALGIPPPVRAGTHALAIDARVDGRGPAQSYRLRVDGRGISIRAADADGAFYGAVTLAQLARRGPRGWVVPCVAIEDAPALRWRVLSDDVSRGPIPTMRYFEERIRTIAAFKMNGYSPYMEHVFADPRHPLAAPADGITPQQLGELAAYAREFHVTLIPEQQTFAHMHGTLLWEENAPLAETPHGYLIAPANPAGERYADDLIADELAAVGHTPFFHIGSDEPFDLGRGASAALVARDGEGAVYTRHVVDTARFVIDRSGARPMIWDDALVRHPELFAALPKSLVFVTWHYEDEPSYAPFIDRIARAGFDQMVAPGDLNWNEIYPDLGRAVANERRFIDEGKTAHVLGLFQTVWNDDGETLFEATWYPVLYAAAASWETGDVDPQRFAADFPATFFGSGDARYAADVAALGTARADLRAGSVTDSSDYLFWADAFDPGVAGRVDANLDLRAIRLAAEEAIAHLKTAPPPPLHPNAARVMLLAARRYDALARNFQIAAEARAHYDDALHFAGRDDGRVYRDLFAVKYLFWEQRDAYLSLSRAARAAREYEDRAHDEASALERYSVAADRAIRRADRINRVTYEVYRVTKTLPAFAAAIANGGA